MMPSAIGDFESGFGKTAAQAIRDLERDIEEMRNRLGKVKDPRQKDNLLRTSVLAGARVIRDRARENAPERTKQLKRGIIARTRRRRPYEDVYRSTVTIDPKAKRARRIAHLVEYGTSKHQIKGGIHPGAKPQPFLRPAVDGDTNEVLDAIMNKARERFRKLDV